MNETIKRGERASGLTRYLTPLGAWALSFGCAVGWGAFVMPGTTFLPIAGPLGTAIGMAVGAVVMLIIGMNYHYLMNRYPDAGGTLTYATKAFGHDHGFMSAWFLVLVYVAIMWANATALPLVARNLLGDAFQFGSHYTVSGYDVYPGETVLSIAAIVLVCFVAMRGKRSAVWVQIVMAMILFGGIVVCFCAVMGTHRGGAASFAPAYAPDGGSPVGQIIQIVVLAPWAFVGFESVSHATEEFAFSTKKTLRLIILALITGGLAYILLSVMAAAILPPGYADWAAYIGDIGKLGGLAGMPTFYATNEAMGGVGLGILAVTLIGGIITGLMGNLIAASRLMYAMAEEKILPAWFGRLNEDGVPKNSILFLMLVSLVIPFFGRVAIGWIVDVNTIGATIAYAYTSFAAYKLARDEGNGKYKLTGLAGGAISVLFFFYFMVPNLWAVSALSTESYLILIAWSIVGFVFFRYILLRDTERRYGKSTIVWIILLFIIFFTSTMWLRETTFNTTTEVLGNLNEYNTAELTSHGITLTEEEEFGTGEFLEEQMDSVTSTQTTNSLVQMALVMVALVIMLSVYNLITQRERQMEAEKIQAEQSNRAKSTFLSNMSHDIRTPMNAIIGYTGLVKKEPGLPSKAKEYLEKIEASNEHLLALINDVLEMSRIESGKMELEPAETDIVRAMDEVHDMFATQMEGKGLVYSVDTAEVRDRWVMCDKNRLNRVLLNLISNAYKFTPEGGSVSVTLRETGAADGVGSFELKVKDTGMGMSPEFAAKVFEAYERERTASNIQGTGLGMAITKSIVELMGGDISVQTEQGKGTTFTILVDFPLADGAAKEQEAEAAAAALQSMDFSRLRLLLVEDNEINREIAELILGEAGFMLDTAENGQIAVDKVKTSAQGYYDCVLMDIQMPVMDGYDAARAIRALPDKALAATPIIAMTANAFQEDIQAALDAGMDGHIAKPIDVNKMLETLAEVLR